jgi:hypothetical protein
VSPTTSRSGRTRRSGSARQLGIDRQIRVRQGNLERTRNPARYIVVLARQP